MYLLLSYSASAQILNKVFPLGEFGRNHAVQPGAFPLKQEQNLYGAAACVTNDFIGCLFKLTPTSAIPAEFCYLRYSDGAPPYGQLGLGPDEQLIGSAYSGGNYDCGTIFTYDRQNGNLTVLHHFAGTDGTGPQGKLVQSGDWIYGTTRAGGQNGLGVLFRIHQDGTDFAVLHHFSSSLGSPTGDLIQLNNGEFIGICLHGGSADLGGIWKTTAPDTAPTFIHEYKIESGYGIRGSVFLSGDSLLYCTTEAGGSFNRGALFRLNAETGERTDICNFSNANGPKQPIGTVTEDSQGRLLGITIAGAPGTSGAFYRIEKDGSNFETRISFSSPYGTQMALGLQKNWDGTICLTLPTGGPLRGGCILEISPEAAAFDEIGSFRGALAEASQVSYLHPKLDGGWLGLSSKGGISNSGTLIEFTAELADIKILVDFGRNGCSTPSGPLLLASDGKYYGVLQYGGPNGKGVLYRLLADLSGYEIVYAFGADNERYPIGNLFEITPGTLAGTCSGDGPTVPGVIFKVDTTGQNYSILKTFSDAAEGSGPALLHYNEVNHELTGVCISGGNQGAGVVFRISADGNSYQKLHDFTEIDGTRPNISAYLAKSGLLYGTTLYGGTDNAGTVFSISPETGAVTLVSHMANIGMSQPTGIFYADSLGYLYGGAVYGGQAGEGGIFRMKNDGQNATAILSDIYGEYLYSVQAMAVTDSHQVVGALYKGFSAPGALFTFELRPKLQIEATESSIQLRWLEIGQNHTLQTTSSLTESWIDSTLLPEITNGTNSVCLGITPSTQFFRLISK